MRGGDPWVACVVPSHGMFLLIIDLLANARSPPHIVRLPRLYGRSLPGSNLCGRGGRRDMIMPVPGVRRTFRRS